uniref:(northern house mosquito) hypothetical protein n=1 Tax=Culex pipiens TaxID=7175 RepID=A0A8D8IFX9_CULPI
MSMHSSVPFVSEPLSSTKELCCAIVCTHFARNAWRTRSTSAKKRKSGVRSWMPCTAARVSSRNARSKPWSQRTCTRPTWHDLSDKRKASWTIRSTARRPTAAAGASTRTTSISSSAPCVRS